MKEREAEAEEEKQADYCVNSFKGHTKKFGFSSTYMESHHSVLIFSGLIRSYSQYREFLSSTSLRMESESVGRSVVSDSL